jgi:hypothetical protein
LFPHGRSALFEKPSCHANLSTRAQAPASKGAHSCDAEVVVMNARRIRLVLAACFAIAGFSTQPSAAAPASVTFPLQASANGHYFVDAHGVPFRVQGDASWDAHLNFNLTALRAYLDDRHSKGFNALFTYTTNPVAYYAGSVAPWAEQLGGPGAGTAALPFTTARSL